MAKKGFTILLVTLGVVGTAAYYYAQQGKELAENIKFRITKIGIDGQQTKKESYLNVILKITIMLTNPTAGKAALKSLALTISQNGNKVADVQNSETVIINPNSNTTAMLTVAIPTIKLFGSVSNAIKALLNGKGLKLNVSGIANFSEGSAKINQDINVA